MKKILYILIIALFAASCTSDFLDDNINMGGNSDQITFSTQTAATRATEAFNTQLQGYGFFVSAYLDSQDYDFMHYFDGSVTYNKSTKTWSNDTEQLWPSTGSITFDTYAYDKEVLEAGSGSIIKNGRTLDYICSPNINEQVDLLAVSTTVANKNTAALKFGHALSQIKFAVDFSGTQETNVTLTKINIMYHNITSDGTYVFGSDGDVDGQTAGNGTWLLGSSVFGDKNDDSTGYATTAIETNLIEKTNAGDDMIFNPENVLIIIPQQVNITENTNDTDKYISVSVEYTLNNANNGAGTQVVTGTMELPVPTKSDNAYKMGKAYTYKLGINGDTISISLDIDDAEKPEYAYGNIDLRLIETPLNHADYLKAISSFATNTTIPESDKPHMYYASAVRAAKLLNDGVRDFVVVGSFDANTSGEHDGKLGYYGSETSPFYIAASSLGMMPDYTLVKEDSVFNKDFDKPDTNHIFSIDLRGVYDFPTLGTMHPDASGDNSLDQNASILTSGIFKDLPLLGEVIFPKGLMAIGDYAFQNCMSLSSVDLSEVKHIEEGAFVDCIGLVNVYGDSLKRIHAYGFDDCVKLEYINLENVTEVDAFGFVNCQSLHNVNLSKLDVIGPHAFNGCSSLTLASGTHIPGFTKVSDYAFAGCSQLGKNGASIDLTAAHHVGDHAFHECTEILLSSGDLLKMKSIGDYAFANCKHIGSIFPIHLPIIDTIGASAFENCSYINIVEGLSNLKKIYDGTFNGCTSLTGTSNADGKLSLPLVTSVGDYAFTETGLIDVTFDANKLDTIGDYAFNNCTSLVSISGLEGVDSIGTYAFAGSSKIKNLELDNVTHVGADFIAGCNSFETFIMPKVDTAICHDHNKNTIPLSDVLKQSAGTLITVNIEKLKINTFESWTSWAENNALETINIASVLELKGAAFAVCKALTSVIASSATIIGSNAFDGCSLLKTVDLSSAKSLGGAVFSGCTSLETVNLSNLETPLGIWFFSGGYTNLKDVNISSVTSIGNGTFNECTALETVDASSAESIGLQAFKGCVSLKELDLSGVTNSSLDGIQNPDDYPFVNAVTENCTLYISQDQFDNHVSGNQWCGATWGSIQVR